MQICSYLAEKQRYNKCFKAEKPHSIKRRCNQDTFARFAAGKTAWLNYRELPPLPLNFQPIEDTFNGAINMFRGIPDLSCIMLVKGAKMIVTTFNEHDTRG